MTPQEAREESVNQLIDFMEKNYQKTLKNNDLTDNPLMRFTYLTQMIDVMSDAPPVEGLLLEALMLRLYMMRSEVATDAEFIRITGIS